MARTWRPLHERFWERVAVSTEPDACWPWQGATKDAYGLVYFEKRAYRAHRYVAYLILGEPPSRSLLMCHRCDNPPCCNPAHLFLGTPADNVADMDEKRRRRPARGAAHVSQTRPWVLSRGEEHPNRKMTEKEVREIRALAAQGVGQRELGARFGIHPSTAYQILTGRTWRHVK